MLRICAKNKPPSTHPPATRPTVDKQSKIILMIVSSLLATLVGIFLILALYQVLPQGLNSISSSKIAGPLLGWGLLSLGVGGILLSTLVISCKYDYKKSFAPSESTNDIKTTPPPLLSPTYQAETLVPKNFDCDKPPELTDRKPILVDRSQLAEPVNLNLPNLDTERFKYSYNRTENWNFVVTRLNQHFIDPIWSAVLIESNKLSNLDIQCQSFSDVQIIFDYYWRDPNDKDRNFPPKVLIEAFKLGKKLVLVELSTERHGLLGVFSSDGSFKIIDPMFSNSKNCNKLADQLNSANICTPDGKPILFSGEYINTHIQKEGNTCRCFTHLYAYQIAKTLDPNAFEEVNGAFLEGRLKVFEDYSTISGAPRVRDMQDKKYSYASFTQSWAYRAMGWKENSWDEVSLAQIFARLKPNNNRLDTVMFAHVVKSRHLPNFFSSWRSPVFIPNTHQEINEITLADREIFEPIYLSLEAYNLPLKTSLSLEKDQYILVWKKGSERLEIFRLQKAA